MTEDGHGCDGVDPVNTTLSKSAIHGLRLTVCVALHLASDVVKSRVSYMLASLTLT